MEMILICVRETLRKSKICLLGWRRYGHAAETFASQKQACFAGLANGLKGRVVPRSGGRLKLSLGHSLSLFWCSNQVIHHQFQHKVLMNNQNNQIEQAKKILFQAGISTCDIMHHKHDHGHEVAIICLIVRKYPLKLGS